VSGSERRCALGVTCRGRFERAPAGRGRQHLRAVLAALLQHRHGKGSDERLGFGWKLESF